MCGCLVNFNGIIMQSLPEGQVYPSVSQVSKKPRKHTAQPCPALGCPFANTSLTAGSSHHQGPPLAADLYHDGEIQGADPGRAGPYL